MSPVGDHARRASSRFMRQGAAVSYDLMVFDPAVAPRDPSDFEAWYADQTRWAEGHSYDDPAVTSQPLQAWFHEMRGFFPPMNGPFASPLDNSTVTDHCIGRHVIYSAFAWSVAGAAYERMRTLARKHRVGFYDVSGQDGEVLFPDEANVHSDG